MTLTNDDRRDLQNMRQWYRRNRATAALPDPPLQRWPLNTAPRVNDWVTLNVRNNGNYSMEQWSIAHLDNLVNEQEFLDKRDKNRLYNVSFGIEIGTLQFRREHTIHISLAQRLEPGETGIGVIKGIVPGLVYAPSYIANAWNYVAPSTITSSGNGDFLNEINLWKRGSNDTNASIVRHLVETESFPGARWGLIELNHAYSPEGGARIPPEYSANETGTQIPCSTTSSITWTEISPFPNKVGGTGPAFSASLQTMFIAHEASGQLYFKAKKPWEGVLHWSFDMMPAYGNVIPFGTGNEHWRGWVDLHMYIGKRGLPPNSPGGAVQKIMTHRFPPVIFSTTYNLPDDFFNRREHFSGATPIELDVDQSPTFFMGFQRTINPSYESTPVAGRIYNRQAMLTTSNFRPFNYYGESPPGGPPVIPT